MKFLVEKRLAEAFGESETLNTFANQAEQRFNKYYVVEVENTRDERIQHNYFAYEEAARKEFENMKKEFADYENYKIYLYKVNVVLETEELDSNIIGTDDFDEPIDEEPIE